MRITIASLTLAGAALLGSSPAAAQTRAAEAADARTLLGFATAIAIHGDEVYVGRPGEAVLMPMPPASTGVVHIFARDAGGAWTERASVTGADVQIGDGFAAALAIRANVLMVGAPRQGDARGAVYVFERAPGGAWVEVGRLAAQDGAPGDSLGFAIVLDGPMAFVGAPGSGDAGAVYVFHQEANGRWAEHHKLTSDSAVTGDRFGAAVAVDGNRAVVGAPGPHPAPPIAGPPPPFRRGAVHVFSHSHDTGWQEEARLVASDTRTVRALGSSVLIDDEHVFAGAPVTGGFAGRVVQFRRDSAGTWNEVAIHAGTGATPPAMFGFALARSSDDILIGAPGAGNLAGAVYVFRGNDTSVTFQEAQSLNGDVAGFAPMLGSSLAASRGLVVAGAPGDAFFEGSGFTFVRDDVNDEWRTGSSLTTEVAGLPAVAGGQVDCEDGSARGFSCADVDLVSFLPVSALGGKRGIMVSDVWGWTDPETGREYAIVGRFDGTAFVDVSDAANPRYLGELPVSEGAVASLWRDMKVYRNHVFIVADGAGAHGVQVFDLTRLRDVTAPPVRFTETAHYDGIHSAHNIVINEETGFAYAVGNSAGGETCGGGLHMINIQDPASPTFAGCYADPQTGNAGTGYTHDAQCTIYHGPDTTYAGREICLNASETALGIADVTDKNSPLALSRGSYPNVGYTHQGWISDDHRHFFINDELDEIAGTTPRTRTLVWDIEDLDDPVLLTEYLGPTTASDHNLYIRGRYMYQSNYVSGLRIVDISDPANPVEVGHFDTVPLGDDAPGFAGSWSNYPYFESGNIIVTSMREGLFVLKKRERPVLP